MFLKDLQRSVVDVASIGLVVGRKMYGRAVADDRDIQPDAPRLMVEALHAERIKVRVSEIFEETPSTKTFRLVSAGKPLFPFRAGQFLTLFLTVGGVRTSRAYSISSPPSHTGHLDITVRKVPDGFVSRYLVDEVTEGQQFEIGGPGGFFYYDPLTDTRDLVFLAGGSGITPFASMMREAAELNSRVKMTLIYGSRKADDVIFFEELSALGRTEKMDVELVLSEPDKAHKGPCGLLDADNLRPIIGSVKGKTFFMCGPSAMYGLCEGGLRSMRVSARRIKKEASGPPPDIQLVEGWPKGLQPDEVFSVQIADGGRRFDANAGEPLLNSLERAGFEVDNMCRSGECGVCRAALVQGLVFMPADVAVRKSDLAFGYIHPCMSYPISDIEIRI